MPLANKIRKTLWALRNRRRLLDVLREEYIKEEETAVLEIKQKEEKERRRQEEERRRLEEEQKAKEEKERKIALIAGSPYFDRDYYARNNIEFQNSELDMAEHYLLYGGFLGKDPGPYFSSEEYLSLHSDVAMEGLNPLLHYEEHGKRENREISYLQRKEPSFPKEAAELERSFDISPSIHHRSAVVSCFLPEGRIPGSLLYLLKEVKKVTDNIVLAGDCPVIESELEKLKGIVFRASFKRHGQYDFGSYKRGLASLRQEGILDEELILLNDSVYGPVYPFKESFEKMTGKGDFWGYVSLVSRGVPYLSSCFLVFRKEVLESWVLDGFLDKVKGSYERGDIVTLFETKLTPYLRERGFEYASYVPEEDHINIFDQPLTLLKKYRMPLLKKKALLRKPIEDLDEVLKTVEREAPELYKEISYTPYEEKLFFPPSFEELETSFKEKEERLKEKYERGEQLKALFLITNPSMFPSFPLFERMKEDGHFKPYIAIIPDLRWPGKEEEDLKVFNEGLKKMGFEEGEILYCHKDERGRWNDICKDMDIVCYNTPYQLSSFRYLPRYAAGRDFLPISVNYGFYRSRYDDKILALDSYRYMWKAFFECEETLAQYKANTNGDGRNGVISGYIKMDRLNEVEEKKSDRKRILVALHHSVEGGANDILSLGNFVRYSDYFLELPDRYPDIDFIYRPHPYLFRMMEREDLWGKEKTAEYLEKLKSKENVFFDDSSDYFPSFKNSDACIQDCGSYLVEYLYTGKPCCYMLKEESDIDRKFSKLGQDCLEQCTIAYDTRAIDAFINDVVIKGNDEKKEGRLAFIKRIMVHYPHAAEAALEDIRETILKGDRK